MKVSGKEVAEAILKKLEKSIKSKNLKPKLAIILAGNNPSSRIYVSNKIKTAKQYGIEAKLFEFSKSEKQKLLKTLDKLNKDPKVHGIIIQYQVYEPWNFDELIAKINPQKDVDGFLETAPYSGAAALAVWEMLTAFSLLEGFKKTENFLKGKKIVILGRGRAAGMPTIKLLANKGFKIISIDKDTKNPTPKIKSGDVIISATGVKNIINNTNLKKGSYVVGVGFGDLNEEEVSKIAKLYNPNIGGIGPLTIACLLKNVVESAKGVGN
ncbi:MAG: Bifunctional protein FolD [Microgenomates group bacterium Gr01-1014_7]|nr:MAG: Bifunctional protein FolD [Microgenomates group bacterium Gr01-1014_7]